MELHFKTLGLSWAFGELKLCLKMTLETPKRWSGQKNKVILFVRTILQAIQRKKHVKIAKTAERKAHKSDTIACFKHWDGILNVLCKPIKNTLKFTDSYLPFRSVQ